MTPTAGLILTIGAAADAAGGAIEAPVLPGHLIYMVTACLLFAIGVYGLITRGHLMRNVMSLNVIGGGVFLFLVAVARRDAGEGGPDPVPHAMTLTGIVVALAASAFALALARRIHAVTGEMRLEPGDDDA